MASVLPTIELYADVQGLHRWRMKARNGKVIADSAEAYANRRNARRAAWSLIDLLGIGNAIDLIEL